MPCPPAAIWNGEARQARARSPARRRIQPLYECSSRQSMYPPARPVASCTQSRQEPFLFLMVAKDCLPPTAPIRAAPLGNAPPPARARRGVGQRRFLAHFPAGLGTQTRCRRSPRSNPIVTFLPLFCFFDCFIGVESTAARNPRRLSAFSSTSGLGLYWRCVRRARNTTQGRASLAAHQDVGVL